MLPRLSSDSVHHRAPKSGHMPVTRMSESNDSRADGALSRLLWSVSTSTSMHRVLVAAAQEFTDKGFHGATTRGIAARADLSPAAVYLHHKSKEDLLYHILLATHTVAVERLRDVASLVRDPAQRLRELVKALVVFQADVRVATRLSTDMESLQSSHRSDVRALRKEMEEIVATAVDACPLIEPPPPDGVKVAVSAIFSLTTGISRWFREGGALSPEELGDIYGAMVLRMLAIDTDGSRTPVGRRASARPVA